MKVSILGIDTGITGGFTIIDESGVCGQVVMPMRTYNQKKTRKMRANEKNPDNRKTKTYIAKVRQLDYPALAKVVKGMSGIVTKAYVEKVSAMPGEGVTSSFSFGICTGAIIALLAAYHIPYELVTPATWTKSVCSGVPKTIDPKDRARVVVSRLFPDDNFVMAGCKKEHMGLVDSALISYYGYNKETRSDG